jgi:ATP-dependent helicase/nuclease subunit A
MARLEPLDPPPPAAPAIDDVIQRICQPYPHRAYASIKAAQSATELVKPSAAAVATSAPLREFDERKAAERLALPRGIASERPASPTDIGTATHLVLQLLDMAAPCDPADIARQVRSLVDRRLIDEPTAAMVDLDSIGWFIQTPLGRQVRRVADRLLREVPVYFPMQPVLPDDAPPPADPRDQVMVRGRVDLLLPGSGGWEIADYKTDAVTADTVSDRADLYRGQLGLYRAGLMTILGEPIRAAHLVFLRPRLIVSM